MKAAAVWLKLALVAMLIGLFAGCATTSKKDSPPEKKFSGSFAIIRAAGDIPGVPESKGKRARWSATEVNQVLYLDEDCQKQLFGQLPGWAQAIVKEGGWSALAIAVGEGAFAAAFPGAEVARYFLGGLGYGFFAGMNTGRYRQDGSEKSALGYCVALQIWEAKNRYQILQGINAVPWYGNGEVALPKATDKTTAPSLPHVNSGQPPTFGR